MKDKERRGGAILSSIKSKRAFEYFANNATDVTTFESGASGSVLIKLSISETNPTPYYSVRSSTFGLPVRSMLLKAVVTVDDDFYVSKKDSFNTITSFNNLVQYKYLNLTHENIISNELALQDLIVTNNLKDDTSDIDPMCPYIFYKSKLPLHDILDTNLSDNNGYNNLMKTMKSKLLNEDMKVTYSTFDEFIVTIEDELKDHIWITVLAMEYLSGLTTFDEAYRENLFPAAFDKNLCQSLNYCSAVYMKYLEFINMARYGCLHLDYHSGNCFVSKFSSNYYEGITGRVIPIDFGRAIKLNESDLTTVKDLFLQNDIDGALSFLEDLYKRVKEYKTDYCVSKSDYNEERSFKEVVCDDAHKTVPLELKMIRSPPETMIEKLLKKLNEDFESRIRKKINISYDSFYKNYDKANKKKVFTSCREILDDYFPKLITFFDLPTSFFDDDKEELIRICDERQQVLIKAYAEEDPDYPEVYVLQVNIMNIVSLRICNKIISSSYQLEKTKTEELFKDVVPEPVVPIIELHEKRKAQIRVNIDTFNQACESLKLDANFSSFKEEVLSLDELKLTTETEDNVVLNSTFTTKFLPLLKKFNPTFENDIYLIQKQGEEANVNITTDEPIYSDYGGGKKKSRKKRNKTRRKRNKSKKH